MEYWTRTMLPFFSKVRALLRVVLMYISFVPRLSKMVPSSRTMTSVDYEDRYHNYYKSFTIIFSLVYFHVATFKKHLQKEMFHELDKIFSKKFFLSKISVKFSESDFKYIPYNCNGIGWGCGFNFFVWKFMRFQK